MKKFTEKSQDLYRGRSSSEFLQVPEPRRKLELATFSSPSTYMVYEGENLDFFQVRRPRRKFGLGIALSQNMMALVYCTVVFINALDSIIRERVVVTFLSD